MEIILVVLDYYCLIGTIKIYSLLKTIFWVDLFGLCRGLDAVRIKILSFWDVRLKELPHSHG